MWREEGGGLTQYPSSTRPFVTRPIKGNDNAIHKPINGGGGLSPSLRGSRTLPPLLTRDKRVDVKLLIHDWTERAGY